MNANGAPATNIITRKITLPLYHTVTPWPCKGVELLHVGHLCISWLCFMLWLMASLCLSGTGCARCMWVQVADASHKHHNDESKYPYWVPDTVTVLQWEEAFIKKTSCTRRAHSEMDLLKLFLSMLRWASISQSTSLISELVNKLKVSKWN